MKKFQLFIKVPTDYIGKYWKITDFDFKRKKTDYFKKFRPIIFRFSDFDFKAKKSDYIPIF